MVKRISARLKSNSGASIILVLILLLMCVMVSSVIVMAAATGASRNAARKNQQRGYIAIMSAVRLIADEVESCGKFVGQAVTLDYACNIDGEQQYIPTHNGETMIVDENNPKHADITENSGIDIWSVDVLSTELDGAFGSLIYDACKAIYDDKHSGYTTAFTIASADERIPDVNCEFIMDSSYSIIIVLTAADSDYVMTLKFNSVVGQGLETSDITCVHTINYNKVKQDGSLIPNQTKEINPVGTKTIKRTTVTWGLPSITKGGYAYVVE